MKHLVRLIPSLVLGAVAGYLYMATLWRAIQPVEFVAVKADLKAGERFTVDNLGSIRINGEPGRLKDTAVLSRDRAILYNRPTNRELKAGDLVLLRDTAAAAQRTDGRRRRGRLPVSLSGLNVVPQLLAAGDQVEFLVTTGQSTEGGGGSPAPRSPVGTLAAVNGSIAQPDRRPPIERIGPFRILSVGQRLSTRSARPGAEASRGQGDEGVITVALKQLGGGKEFDPPAARLVEVLGTRPGAGKLMLVIHPPRTAPEATAPARADAEKSEDATGPDQAAEEK